MRLVRIITIRYKYNSSLEIREFLLHGDQATQYAESPAVIETAGLSLFFNALQASGV